MSNSNKNNQNKGDENKAADPIENLLQEGQQQAQAKEPAQEAKETQTERRSFREDHRKERIKSTAFELFARRDNGFNSKAVAIRCLRSASDLLDTFDQFDRGEIVFNAPEELLANCFAQNLKKNHPINLVSRKYGNANLKLIVQISAELEAQPALEKYEKGDIEWDAATTANARVLLPHYANRIKEFEKARQAAAAN